jgi:signal transduction histidine kinase
LGLAPGFQLSAVSYGLNLVSAMDELEHGKRRIKELEMELEDAKSLSGARERLLNANIAELNDVFSALREKIREIRERDERIRNFDEILTRANRLSSLGELAASIAHEIKNPLISIQGFAARIGKVKDQASIERYAALIEHEAERLSNVLARLLEYSRMSEPDREYLDVNSIVDDTILFLEHHLTRFRKIALSVEKKSDLSPVFVDKIQIQQALINIVMNAAQSMPEGGPLVIKTGQEKEGDVWISVTDRGVGIADENMAKIFEPFFTTKGRGEGTGLGLSLSKRLMEANKGRIEVTTQLGEGSTFRLLLPSSPAASREGT